jgi:hypothetical protein
MSFGFFNKAKKVKTAQESITAIRATPAVKPRTERLARKTQVMALAAHIGQAGQKSRIGLPHWGG